MIFLNVFKSLLPRARAWSITAIKPLRTFWLSLTVLGDDYKDFADQTIYDNAFAQRTELLDEWIKAFGLSLPSNLTEQEKKDRLAAAWAEKGGQSPAHIQGVLQDSGFDVYIHEWWLPGYISLSGAPFMFSGNDDAVSGNIDHDVYFGAPLPKNPFDYLRPTYLSTQGVTSLSGAPFMFSGNDDAVSGSHNEKIGYPLVNKIDITRANYIMVSGKSFALSGRLEARSGNFDGIIFTRKDYTIPNDPDRWRRFVYVGAEMFPGLAEVPQSRKEEFENLLLKIMPTQLWIGVLVKYT